MTRPKKVIFQSMPDGSTAVLEHVQPTQAQIEAAARAMFDLEYRLLGSDWVIPKWDESYRSYWGPLASAALTAAAEVEEQSKDDWLRRESDLIAQVERATIERCVQAVDNIDGDGSGMIYRKDAVAAIRALKEKPKP